MGLNGYKQRCSKTVGGVSAVEMVAAKEVSTAEYNHKQGSYSRLIVKPDAVMVRYEFAEDSASYSEKLSREKGVVKVVHTLSFLLRGVGQQQRDAITERTKESRGGVVAVVLVVALFFTTRYAVKQKNERTRLESNQTTLLSKAQVYRVRDSLNAITSQELTLRLGEFSRSFAELTQLVSDMGLKIKRVESVTQSAIKSYYQIETPSFDTIVRIKSKVDTSVLSDADVEQIENIQHSTATALGQGIDYRSPHITLKGVFVNREFHGEITTYDTITQVVHRVPRRFLFIRWGTKELRQEMVSSNPHSQITYSRIIKIERRSSR